MKKKSKQPIIFKQLLSISTYVIEKGLVDVKIMLINKLFALTQFSNVPQ